MRNGLESALPASGFHDERGGSTEYCIHTARALYCAAAIHQMPARVYYIIAYLSSSYWHTKCAREKFIATPASPGS